MDVSRENSYKLSIILPTLNRADVLPRTLGYLARQDIEPGDFEVIIIEDGCTEITRTTVEQASKEVPFTVSFMQNDGHRGPGYTENRGIRAAKAPLVLILADDIFLDPGALRAHISMHEQNPGEEVAVLGKVIQSPELTETVFIRNWDPFGFVKLEGATELPYYMFWACNISLKCNFLIEKGMFLEHRGKAADGKGGGGAAHEDVELGFRLHKHGLRILYGEQAWGYHYHPYKLSQAMQRYYERGVNWEEFRLFVPDPEFVVVTHLLNSSTLADHIKVLKGPNTLRGMDRYLTWHLLRYLARSLVYNGLTVPLLWKPLMNLAEKNNLVSKLMSRRVYGSFLFYFFTKGVADAKVDRKGNHPASAETG